MSGSAGERRALVTGAGKRLGRAMALGLAGDGWDVAVHYNGSAEGAEATVEEARRHGVRAASVQADLLDEAATGSLVGRAAEALGGRLTLLVNNASIFEDDRVATLTAESWRRAIDSNLRAPVLLSAAFAAQAPEVATDANGEPVATGAIVNMIDQRLLKPTPYFVSYTVAKSGLEMFTRTSAQALAPAIRVNAIGPGPTLQGERQSEAHFTRQRRACVLGRGADPDDILAALRFILACKALTGQMIAIDGGQHLVWKTPDVVGTEP